MIRIRWNTERMYRCDCDHLPIYFAYRVARWVLYSLVLVVRVLPRSHCLDRADKMGRSRYARYTHDLRVVSSATQIIAKTIHLRTEAKSVQNPAQTSKHKVHT